MNDVERYEMAEKVVELYRESGGILTLELFNKYFEGVEVAEEDQVLIINMAQELIQHENEIAGISDEESDTNQEEAIEGEVATSDD